MEPTKKKIIKVVSEYKRIFPQEFVAFQASFAVKQRTTLDKWARVKGADAVERKLIEMPATLHTALDLNLTEEEKDWFYAREDYKQNWAGMKWFMETFPEFKLTKDF